MGEFSELYTEQVIRGNGMSGDIKIKGQRLVCDLDERIDEVLEEIESVVNDYWQKWRSKNKYLKTLELQEGKHLRGSIAPRKYDVKGKCYVEWFVYGPGRYGGFNRSWGERIKPREGPRYYQIQFHSRSKEWELDMIEATENKLRPLRYMYEALRKCKVSISRTTKNISELETSMEN